MSIYRWEIIKDNYVQELKIEITIIRFLFFEASKAEMGDHP